MDLSHDCGLSGCTCDDFSDLKWRERVSNRFLLYSGHYFETARSCGQNADLDSMVWAELTDCLMWLSMKINR